MSLDDLGVTVFYYEPRTPSEHEAAMIEYWERVQMEGADVLDAAGNFLCRIKPADYRSQITEA